MQSHFSPGPMPVLILGFYPSKTKSPYFYTKFTSLHFNLRWPGQNKLLEKAVEVFVEVVYMIDTDIIM